MTRAPVFFISHGAPTFAIQPGVLGPQLQALGANLRVAAAALIVSPHWQTRNVRVMATAKPETIHDFAGFPDALYQLHYPAPGAPALAIETAQLLAEAGFQVEVDDRRGLDHGAWVPLRYLLPDAQLPVYQVSMPHDLDAAGALRMGHALAPLRERGVLIIGSGSLTHNLHEFRQTIDEAPYVLEFARWAQQSVLRHDIDELVDYRQQAPSATRAHPTEEHYLPLLVAMGATSDLDVVSVIEGRISYGVISMDSYVWGLPTDDVADDTGH